MLWIRGTPDQWVAWAEQKGGQGALGRFEEGFLL